jgi:hypothetical protein
MLPVPAAYSQSYSQSLTGKWVGSASPYYNGLEMVVALDQAADGTLTGYTQGGRFNDTITGGKVEGGKFYARGRRTASRRRYRHVDAQVLGHARARGSVNAAHLAAEHRRGFVEGERDRPLQPRGGQ